MSGSFTFADVRQSALDTERNMSGSFTFTDVRQSALDREIIATRLTLATSVGLQPGLLHDVSHNCGVYSHICCVMLATTVGLQSRLVRDVSYSCGFAIRFGA